MTKQKMIDRIKELETICALVIESDGYIRMVTSKSGKLTHLSCGYCECVIGKSPHHAECVIEKCHRVIGFSSRVNPYTNE